MAAVIFIQEHGRPSIIEATLKEEATIGDLHDVLTASGVSVNSETFIFIDDAEEHVNGELEQLLPIIKHGSRIHVCHCERIKVTVQFLDKAEEQEFPPGVRVRTVKAQAVNAFKIAPKDAAEHVLQICGSTERPTSDTPLHQLVEGESCAICFNLVPEKRVEG